MRHPPKSSSGVTLGGSCDVLPKPLRDEVDWLGAGSDPPQAEKSFAIGAEDVLGTVVGLGFGVSTGAGSGVDHASFEPQASAFVIPAKLLELLFWVVGVGLGADCVGTAGAERLNGEVMLDGGEDTGFFCVA